MTAMMPAPFLTTPINMPHQQQQSPPLQLHHQSIPQLQPHQQLQQPRTVTSPAARDKPRAKGGRKHPSLFVGGLPKSFKEEDVRAKVFDNYDGIQSIVMKQSYCFVNFHDPSKMQEYVEKLDAKVMFEGKKLGVRIQTEENHKMWQEQKQNKQRVAAGTEAVRNQTTMQLQAQQPQAQPQHHEQMQVQQPQQQQHQPLQQFPNLFHSVFFAPFSNETAQQPPHTVPHQISNIPYTSHSVYQFMQQPEHPDTTQQPQQPPQQQPQQQQQVQLLQSGLQSVHGVMPDIIHQQTMPQQQQVQLDLQPQPQQQPQQQQMQQQMQPAKSKKRKGRNKPSLFVGGLSKSVTEQALRDIFGPYGKIELITVKEAYAFVDFEDPDVAEKAVKEDGRMLDGKALGVRVQTKENKQQVKEAKSKNIRLADYFRGGEQQPMPRQQHMPPPMPMQTMQAHAHLQQLQGQPMMFHSRVGQYPTGAAQQPTAP